MIQDTQKYNLHRVFTLFLVCLSSFGLQFFSGAGNFWFILIFLLNLRYITHIPMVYVLRILLVILFCFVFFFAKGMIMELWLVRGWLIVLLLITIYKDQLAAFAVDFSKLAEWSSYYSLLHIPVYLLFGTTNWGNTYTTFHLFYYNKADTFLGIPRIQGFAWEPSCWSYLLIVNLIFVLFRRESKEKVFLALLAILFCNSTTVIMSTAVVIAVHLWLSIRRNKWIIPVVFLVVVAAFPFFKGRLDDKLASGSGLARISDFYILKDVLSTHPFMGGDAYHVSTNMQAFRARQRALRDWDQDINKIGYDGYYGEEMVNDLAALLVEWGIILGPFILLLYLKTPFLKEKELRLMFMAGTVAVITGTPISRTPIFFLFPLSVLIMTPGEVKKLLVWNNRQER